MKNLEILEFRQAIWNFVADSEIPEVVKTIILKDILTEQENIAVKVVEQERKEREQAMQAAQEQPQTEEVTEETADTEIVEETEKAE